jgi:hypothetical protein
MILVMMRVRMRVVIMVTGRWAIYTVCVKKGRSCKSRQTAEMGADSKQTADARATRELLAIFMVMVLVMVMVTVRAMA